MKLRFIVNPVFEGWYPDDTRLGGTEEAIVEWSARMAALGHEVTVYHNQRPPVRDVHTYRGVTYKQRSAYLKDKGDFTFNFNYFDLPPQEPTALVLNFIPAMKLDLSAFDYLVLPTQWTIDEYQPKHPNIKLIPYGYDQTRVYPGSKIPKTVLYASSPDRGLEDLARVWPAVVEAHPDAQLLVTYNGHVDTPNTICFGNVDSEMMDELYRTSDIWCHPANGGELYCITGIKAQAAGCWPVYFPTMALSETVRFGTKSTPSTLAQDLITALNGHPAPPQLEYPTWDSTTQQLLALVNR